MSRAGSVFKTEAGERAVLEHYDEFLARWPVPVATRMVDTRHGRIAVHVCGRADGPALVLIHGAGSNALLWIGDVEGWARDFRVFAIDVIGEPGRSAPVRPALKGPAYSDWLADVLDGLGLARAILVGLSQGGWIALKLATARPERVARLVLLSPAGVVRDRLGFVLRVVPLLLRGKLGARAILRLAIGPEAMPPVVLEFLDLIVLHTRPRMTPAPLFSDEELGRLTMPVLLVGGEKDALRDCRAIAGRLRGVVPRLESILLPEAGHALVKVGSVVEPFLRLG